MKDLRCGLVSSNPFPIGNVSTLRYSSYMMALAKVGCFSKIYIYTPSRTAKPNKVISGTHKGVHFDYTAGKISLKKRNFISMYYYLIKGLIKSWKKICDDNINCLILYGENRWIVNLFYKSLCVLKHIKFYGDRSEYPSSAIMKSPIRKKLYSMKISWFDGMILMTDALNSFYSNLLIEKKSTFLLPMTIDPSRFNNVLKQIVNQQYIAVVFGTHNRDGIDDSIIAYNKYREKGGNFNLHLIGDYNNMPNKPVLDNIIKNSKFYKDIIICGSVQNNLVPQILANASCLLTTPLEYSSGGFPTKVGEYMLSMTPIVATSAGDLLKFIQPDKEALFAPPHDIDKIADLLLFIENHPNEAHIMATNAREKVLRVFNADTYIGDLIKFLQGYSINVK